MEVQGKAYGKEEFGSCSVRRGKLSTGALTADRHNLLQEHRREIGMGKLGQGHVAGTA